MRLVWFGLVLAMAGYLAVARGEGEGTQSIIGAADEATAVEEYLDRHWCGRPECAPEGRAFNAVARLSVGCTGWLLTPRHLVTNQHCVKNNYQQLSVADHPLFDDYDESNCKGTEIRFDYQTHVRSLDEKGYRRPPEEKFGCKRVVLAHQPLDLSIIELDHPVSPETAPLPLAVSFRPDLQPVFLVGHPAGEPKKIAYKNTIGGKARPCEARAARFAPGHRPEDDPHPWHTDKDRYSFVHTCDSRGGNSGSPLLDARTLAVVGLHWGGWTDCKWPHYDPDGKVDKKSQKSGKYSKEAAVISDTIPYRPGNTAIAIDDIRDFVLGLPTGEGKGQVPAAVRDAFVAR